MTITYPLAFPSDITVNSVAPSLSFTVSSTRSPFTGERQGFRWDREMWTFAYTTPPHQPDVADQFIAFAMKLRGSFGVFLLGDKSRPAPRGVGGGTPVVDGIDQNGYDLHIKNAPHSVTGWLKKGDYYQLGTGINSRLYKLYEDVDTDSSGHAILSGAPRIRITPGDGDAVVINNAVGCFVMSQNDVSWNTDINGLTRYQFTAEEYIV